VAETNRRDHATSLARGAAHAGVDVVVVLGGDGTMLRALQRFLGRGIPVLGVNFGRVGFLSAIPRDELEQGLARVFAGECVTVELPTIEVELADETHVGVNDVVVTSGGVSMGDHDVVKHVVRSEGTVGFWSIDLRPGATAFSPWAS